VLHTFSGGGTDGSSPRGDLILSGSTLYGVTNWGGPDNSGVAFSIDTSGSGFGLLHTFAGGLDDGANPRGTLTLVGSRLYGLTDNGGDDGLGVIFSMNIDGSDYRLEHEFAGGEGDGSHPYYTGMILDSSQLPSLYLYGTSRLGGINNSETVFVATPEPGVIALVGLGALTLALYRRKRKQPS